MCEARLNRVWQTEKKDLPKVRVDKEKVCVIDKRVCVIDCDVCVWELVER